MEEKNILTLEFEDGKTLDCEVLFVFDVGGKAYIALAPQDDSDEVFLYRYEETGEDGFEMSVIEDSEELAAAAAEFGRIMDELEAEEN